MQIEDVREEKIMLKSLSGNSVAFGAINYENKTAPGEVKTKTALFGVTDIHGNFSAMSRLVTASKEFTQKYNSTQTDTFKISSGDIGLSVSEDRQRYCLDFLKKIGTDIATLGNHEFDLGSAKLAKIIKESPIKFVSSNFDVPVDNPLHALMSRCNFSDNKDSTKKIFNSYIETKPNGEKYGFIGSLPTDLDKVVGGFDKLGINFFDVDKTKKAIAEEIKNLKKQGINKIIFASHLRDEQDEEIAKDKETAGIDVILAGHSHKKIEKVVMSAANEPVVIMEAGENGANYSEVEVDFDKNGVIQKAVGEVKETKIHKEDADFEKETSEKYGSKEPIGQIIDNIGSTATVDEKNAAMAGSITDALRKKTDAQIAFINISFSRKIPDGAVSARDIITEVFPFEEYPVKVTLTEKEIIDTLKTSAEQPKFNMMLQSSGLRYTIDLNSNQKIKDVKIVDTQGKLVESLNAENPSDKKTFTAVYGSVFLYLGGLGYTSLKDRPIIEKYPKTYSDCYIDYVKSQKEPIILKHHESFSIIK